MPKHTPGPWKIKDNFAKTAINTEKKHIAMVNYWKCQDKSGISDEEHEANARLIAAAPELLEALILADEIIGVELFEHVNQSAAEAHYKIRAAIAKAKGGT